MQIRQYDVFKITTLTWSVSAAGLISYCILWK